MTNRSKKRTWKAKRRIAFSGIDNIKQRRITRLIYGY